MRHPLVLELAGVPVVCVGGGPIATAKVMPLAEAGAVVTVISPTCTDTLAQVVSWERREFAAGDLQQDPPVMLAIAATGVPSVDQTVALEAAGEGIWCQRIDGLGNVTAPSVIRRAGMILAISTGAPALTARLRAHLEETLDTRWGVATKILSGLRADPAVRQALAEVAPADRRRRWQRAVDVALSDGPTPGADDARAALMGQDGG